MVSMGTNRTPHFNEDEAVQKTSIIHLTTDRTRDIKLSPTQLRGGDSRPEWVGGRGGGKAQLEPANVDSQWHLDNLDIAIKELERH